MIDGPFAETRELVAGFWLWEVKDMAEAVEWAKRCPNPMPGPSELEIRPVFEMADFGDAETKLKASTNDPFFLEARRLRSAALIEIRTDAEHTGVGETYAGYFCPEVVPAIVEFYRPILLGADPCDIHTLRRRMEQCGAYWSRVGLAANGRRGRRIVATPSDTSAKARMNPR